MEEGGLWEAYGMEQRAAQGPPPLSALFHHHPGAGKPGATMRLDGRYAAHRHLPWVLTARVASALRHWPGTTWLPRTFSRITVNPPPMSCNTIELTTLSSGAPVASFLNRIRIFMLYRVMPRRLLTSTG